MATDTTGFPTIVLDNTVSTANYYMPIHPVLLSRNLIG